MVAVTRGQFTVRNQQRAYDSSRLPQCPRCDGKRVFECQLMPNLINVLRTSSATTVEREQTEEERKQELEVLLKQKQGGMEWGTCMIFSCENDCSGEETRNWWTEEYVLVQWDV